MLLPGFIQMISILLITATLDDPHGQMLRTGVKKETTSITSPLPRTSILSQQIRWTRQEHKSLHKFNYSINQCSLRVQTLGHEAKSATLPRTRICFTFDALSTFISDDEATISSSTYAMTDKNCECQMMKRVLLGISNPPLPTVPEDN
jgi:hypothetical protein